MKSVSVTFPYWLTGIPKACRRVREMLVWGSTCAVIPMASRSDVEQVAFRVEFPYNNRLRYVVPTIPAMYRMRHATEEILIFSYQGKLWWPLKIDRDRSRCDRGVVLDLLEQLDSRHHDLLNMLPPGVSPTTVIPRPQMRSVEKNGCGSAEAFVQRTLYENLLICGDRVYVRGGAPLFVKNCLGHKRTWEIQVVDPGPDRAAHPVLIGLRTGVDVHTDWWAQAALREGSFWRADLGDLATAAAHRTQITMPRIEICDDTVLSENSRALVLDAIFREALQIAEYWRDSPLVDRLAPGLEETTNKDTTTRRRAALSQFFQALAEMHLSPGMIKFRDIFLRFDNTFLAPEDEGALSSLPF